jgi:hypothetical protein
MDLLHPLSEEDRFNREEPSPEFLRKEGDAGLRFRLPQDAPDDVAQFLGVAERLGEVVRSPRLHGIDGVPDRAEGRHEDPAGIRPDLAPFPHQIQPREPGHAEVGDHQVDLGPKVTPSPAPRPRPARPRCPSSPGWWRGRAHHPVVVDDQYGLWHWASSFRQRISKTAPLPSSRFRRSMRPFIASTTFFA